jgi:hypothetical protein
MKRSSLSAFAFLIVALLSFQTASAQFPRLPRIPKPERPKPTPTPDARPATTTTTATTPDAQPQTRTETNPARSSSPSGGEAGPTIAKDSIQLTAFTNNAYRGNYDNWSWVPKIEYRVNGPIPSGSQLYVEYTIPGGAPVKFDCATEETASGRWWKTSCGGRDIPEDKSTTYTGPVNFSIRMRNELSGTDATLFTGKAKVGKVRSNEQGPKAVNKFVYYVDHDWNLPIGYVYLTADELNGWDAPDFHVSFWVRGDAYNFKPHLFLNGKEVGKKSFEGEEVGKAGCESELDNNTTHFVDDSVPQKAKWSRVRCSFPNVKGWDKTGEKHALFGPPHLLASNPGEYELKVLWNNRLARSIKFKVGPDGKFDNGIAGANKLGSDRVIVPVQIIGDQDGAWNRTAWQTEAFYGHPLAGFAALP